MTNGITGKVNGYRCYNCGHVWKTDEAGGERCPKCGGTKLRAACCAKLKRRNGVCPNPAMDNGRCDKHGGKTPPPGPTHPNYTHGRHSKYLPTAVAKHFDEAMADPEFLSIRPNAALVHARKKELEKRLETGESSATWKELREAWGEFERGNRLQREAATLLDDDARTIALTQSREIIGAALDSIKRLITGGASEQQQWNELLKINSLEEQMKQSEVSRLQRAAQIMTLGEVAMLIHQLQQAVMLEIKDKEQLRRIGVAFNSILQTGAAPAIEAPKTSAEN